MTKEMRKAAHEFMFKEFGKSIWWEVKDLTQAGNPQGNPPDLNLAEAKSLFHELFKMDLVIPAKNEHKEDCFIIHQAKEKEWKALINPPNFIQRHWKQALLWIGAFILWTSSLVYSTYITKTVEHRVEQINQKVIKWETLRKRHYSRLSV